MTTEVVPMEISTSSWRKLRTLRNRRLDLLDLLDLLGLHTRSDGQNAMMQRSKLSALYHECGGLEIEEQIRFAMWVHCVFLQAPRVPPCPLASVMRQ